MTKCHTWEWKPEGSARAHVLIVHGYAEHGGRYADFAATLAGLGFHVHSFDHAGHGKSPGKRGYVASFEALVTELTAQVEKMVADAGGQSCFLFAHSMGGLIATNYLTRGGDGLTGAVISSPLLAVPEGVSPVLLRLAGFLGRWLPWLPVDRLDSASISRVPEAVAAYDADPLVYHGPVLARTGAQLTAAIAETAARFSAVTLPLLVLHGTDDGLAPISGSRRLVAEAGSEDVSSFFQEGGYHELLNDVGSEAVVQHVAAWLEERVGAAPGTAPTSGA